MAKRRRRHGARKPRITRGISAFGVYGWGGYYGGYPGYADGGGTAQAPLNADQFGGDAVGAVGDSGGGDGGGGSV